MVPAMVVSLGWEETRSVAESHNQGIREGSEGARRGLVCHIRPALVTSDGEQGHHDAKTQGVGYQCGDEEEFGELLGRPSPLEVAAPLIEGDGGNGQGEDIALNEGGCQEGPRVYQRELWDEVEVGDDDLRVGTPLLVADGGAEDALQTEGDEQDAGDGGDVYSGRHRDGVGWGRARARVQGADGRALRAQAAPSEALWAQG